MKKSILSILFTCLLVHSQAQVTFLDAYDQFKQQAQEEYENFRDEANRKYADFVRKAWEEHKVMPAIPKPKEEEVPPLVIPKEDLQKSIESNPISIDDEVVDVPTIDPQPLPVEPIREQPVMTDEKVDFMLYGTSLQVRFGKTMTIRLNGSSPDALADGWERLSSKDYDNLIRDCLELRITRCLNDWAYLKMLDAMAQACMGGIGNEATLLMAYVYCQSGYKMRLAMAGERLYMLYASQHTIYDKGYFTIDGENFYVYGNDVKQIGICEASFPKEKSLSLWIPQAMKLTERRSGLRTLKAEQFPDMMFHVCVNKNIIDFMNDYPTSTIDKNPMTRWAMYANTPFEEMVKGELIPKFREKLKGFSQKDAVERLLNWVQTAFVYEYDDKIWGGDRAFFAEETLFYPYCDCEDRAILFTHLVRDLLGLKCILVYYPGHLASAVQFTDYVHGDYIMLNGGRFVVCDPTYIGAPIGCTMPNMENSTATVILLE